MNAEYQRLQAEASEVVRQMPEWSTTVDFFSALDHAKFERQDIETQHFLDQRHTLRRIPLPPRMGWFGRG